MDKEEIKERHKLEEIIEKIDKDVDSVILEGWSDKKVIRKLGFSGKIFLSAERTVKGLAEDVERGSERVAVLTDFDKHGKEQNNKIRQELQENMDVISSARREFGKQLTSRNRYAVEDAAPLFQSKEKKFIEAALDRILPKDKGN